MTNLRQSLVAACRRFVELGGGMLLSRRSHHQLLVQRATAVKALVNTELSLLHEGLAGIVFSKDRALQLYSLLSTYSRLVKNPAPLTVLYSSSTEGHTDAYLEAQHELKDRGLDVSFVRQGAKFKEDLLAILEAIKVRNLFFLVDDIIFIRPVDLGFVARLDPQRAILSLRHGPHLRRSYTAAVRQIPPTLVSSPDHPELLQFHWFEQGNEWSDPWSVDGQILSTAEVRVFSRISDYHAPNSYEGQLKTFNDLTLGRIGLCYPQSKILNLPINRVQTEIKNYSGETTPEFLLERWSEGLMLDTAMFETHVPMSPHENHEVKFKRRPGLADSCRQESYRHEA